MKVSYGFRKNIYTNTEFTVEEKILKFRFDSFSAKGITQLLKAEPIHFDVAF